MENLTDIAPGPLPGTPEEARAALADLVRRSVNRRIGQERPFLLFDTDTKFAYAQFCANEGVLWVDVPAGSCEGSPSMWMAKVAILGADTVSYTFTDDDGYVHPGLRKRLSGVDEGLAMLDALLAVNGRPWIVAITEQTPDNQ